MRRTRCVVCDLLDHHSHYVRLRNDRGRYIGWESICDVCRDGHRKREIRLVGTILKKREPIPETEYYDL